MVSDGDLIFLSGQCSMDENANPVGVGDSTAQARQCFNNIQTLLGAVGCTLADIVKLTCFMVDAEVFPAYSRVKAELFPANPPAGTGVVVNALLVPEFLLEVDAIAVRPRREAHA